MRKLFIILSLIILTISVSASGKKTDFYIGKWDVVIKGTPGGDSKLVVDLKQDGDQLKGIVSSKKDGTVDIKEIELTTDGLSVRFKSGWFTVELVMKEKDANHCTCKLAGHYNGESERIASSGKISGL